MQHAGGIVTCLKVRPEAEHWRRIDSSNGKEKKSKQTNKIVLAATRQREQVSFILNCTFCFCFLIRSAERASEAATATWNFTSNACISGQSTHWNGSRTSADRHWNSQTFGNSTYDVRTRFCCCYPRRSVYDLFVPFSFSFTFWFLFCLLRLASIRPNLFDIPPRRLDKRTCRSAAAATWLHTESRRGLLPTDDEETKPRINRCRNGIGKR